MVNVKNYKLSPCPRCLHEDSLRIAFVKSAGDSVELRIKCSFCNYKGPLSSTQENAAQLWNADYLDQIDERRMRQQKLQHKSKM